MKKYKLLKDLPTFEAGDIFQLEDDGNLYLIDKKDSRHWCDKVRAYTSKTLARFPNILKEWFEEIEDDKYWCIDWTEAEVGGVYESEYDYESEMDRFNNKIGNKFETKEGAELAIQKLMALKRLKTQGFEFKSYKFAEGLHIGATGIIAITATFPIPNVIRRSDLELLFGNEVLSGGKDE